MTLLCDSQKHDVTEKGTCPVQELLSRLGDKWSILVIIVLANADPNSLRFSDLLRQVSGISQRMLTLTLRYLERDGILSRKQFMQIPPRVEYQLTEQGKSLLVPVKSLFDWVSIHWPEIQNSRKKYDSTPS